MVCSTNVFSVMHFFGMAVLVKQQRMQEAQLPCSGLLSTGRISGSEVLSYQYDWSLASLLNEQKLMMHCIDWYWSKLLTPSIHCLIVYTCIAGWEGSMLLCFLNSLIRVNCVRWWQCYVPAVKNENAGIYMKSFDQKQDIHILKEQQQ